MVHATSMDSSLQQLACSTHCESVVTVRLIIAEPDVDLLEGHLRYFQRLEDFDPRGADNYRHCIELFESFSPNALMLEPAMPNSERVLELASMPVIVLSRFQGSKELHANTAITKYFIKPMSLVLLSDQIRELVGAH